MPERLAGRLCPGCLLRLALDEPRERGPMLDPDSYRLVTILDADDRGTTYLAESEEGRGLVTVEVLRAAARAPGGAAAFEARIAALASLRHLAIARVVGGWATAEGDRCLVTEYVAGRTLASREARRALPVDEVIRLFGEICGAVEHAHDRGVGHGRLRPSSIVLVEGAAGRAFPRLTRFEVSPPTDVVACDLAALGALFARVATPALAGPRLDEIVRRSAGEPPEGHFPTVAALGEAIASLDR